MNVHENTWDVENASCLVRNGHGLIPQTCTKGATSQEKTRPNVTNLNSPPRSWVNGVAWAADQENKANERIVTGLRWMRLKQMSWQFAVPLEMNMVYCLVDLALVIPRDLLRQFKSYCKGLRPLRLLRSTFSPIASPQSCLWGMYLEACWSTMEGKDWVDHCCFVWGGCNYRQMSDRS